MIVDLPYPHKALWPNGRPHWAAKHRETAKHRQWAWIAGLGLKAPRIDPAAKIGITITVYPKPKGPVPDADNCISAAKSLLDGLADALGVNDRHFAAPRIIISTERTSRFLIEVTL